MKKQLLTLFFSGGVLLSQAQPTLNSAEMLPVGSTLTMKTVMDLSVIDTIKGANVTWDFTTIQNDNSVPDFIVETVDPATTPYASSFTSANYCWKESPATAYRYFNKTSAKMERVGSWFNGTTKTYSDPQVEYVFPMTMGTFNYDTWDNSASSFGGTYELECIGYGTLKVPGKTYSDALLVRVYSEESFLQFYSYFWYSADNGAVLMQYIVGDGFFIADRATYTSALTITGVSEKELVKNISYNNPVASNLSVNISVQEPASLEYTLVNALGETMHTGSCKVGGQEEKQIGIDVSGFKAGMYYLSLRSDKSNEVLRTIKLVKM